MTRTREAEKEAECSEANYLAHFRRAHRRGNRCGIRRSLHRHTVQLLDHDGRRRSSGAGHISERSISR